MLPFLPHFPLLPGFAGSPRPLREPWGLLCPLQSPVELMVCGGVDGLSLCLSLPIPRGSPRSAPTSAAHSSQLLGTCRSCLLMETRLQGSSCE